ncbi:hypothetical protein [Microbispora sp. NBRC 16548]|uniref:hypothetical protein n=1 Tax=Microbispora sp. NBRC 16548 TaxID=3030994 RepID=UPI0024A51399|nr:hypothetical protein [Microbispora sp. NBRC 16548]GLX10724.1 hypothetical protein Misp03_76500 [Microbispora sp. NBRC 16548]
MRSAIERLVREATGLHVLPPLLDAAVSRLEQSTWPEAVTRWSRLTPSGFPVELTIGGDALRWTAEAAPPEVADSARLDLAVAILAAHGQAPDPALADALRHAQAGADLRFGAWIGGRESPARAGAFRLKLYAEIPPAFPPPGLSAPSSFPWRLLPYGARARMLGVEPARGRTEVYVRLPAVDPLALLPFMYATGHGAALGGVERGLADGLGRLRGRRLGLSVARESDGATELALFASARTLFPAEPAMLAALVRGLGDGGTWRVGLVTLGLDPEGRGLRTTVGISPGMSPRHGRACGATSVAV